LAICLITNDIHQSLINGGISALFDFLLCRWWCFNNTLFRFFCLLCFLGCFISKWLNDRL